METPQRKSPWAMIFLLCGAGVLSAFQVGKVPPVLSDIRAELAINLFQAGWILSIFNLTGLLLGMCTGVIADAVGHRRLMLIGFGLQALGSALGSVTGSFYLLLATRFVEGAGFMAVVVSAPTLIFQVVAPRDTKLALSFWTSYLPTGVGLMMILLPLILTVTDWRGLWQINALILSAYALVLAAGTCGIHFDKPDHRVTLKTLARDIFTTATSPGPLVLALIFITYALQWLAVMGFLPTLIVEKFEFSKSMASILTAAMVFMNIIGNLAGGKLLQKGIPRWQLIAFASTCMGLCAIVIYTSEFGFLVNYAGCLLFSTVGGLIPASVLGGAPLYAPTRKLIAATNGIIIQGGQSGQLIGPPLLAYLVSRTGTWECGAVFLGSVAFIGVLLSFLLSRLKAVE